MKDKLNLIFELQRTLMERLVKIDPDVAWPVDITSTAGQKICREVTLRSTEELHEALQHLKKWKSHKHVDDYDFDHDAFLEEIVDSLHYIFELLILVDIGAEELFQAFHNKHQINLDRVKDKIQRIKLDV